MNIRRIFYELYLEEVENSGRVYRSHMRKFSFFVKKKYLNLSPYHTDIRKKKLNDKSIHLQKTNLFSQFFPNYQLFDIILI